MGSRTSCGATPRTSGGCGYRIAQPICPPMQSYHLVLGPYDSVSRVVPASDVYSLTCKVKVDLCEGHSRPMDTALHWPLTPAKAYRAKSPEPVR